MNKKFAAVSLGLVLVLTNCTSISASATQLNTTTTVEKSTITLPAILAPSIKKTQITRNTDKMESVMNKLKKRINRTWYVFGGQTPSGWDCSGLVLWFYKNFGIELRHSASAQKYYSKPKKYTDKKAVSGIVKSGDIITCLGGAHNGIYDKDGYMIHSPRPGVSTKRDKITNLFYNCTYTRVIKTN